MKLDIHAPTHARRQAIDWRRVHITSDSRAPFGMFGGTRVSPIERLLRFAAKLHRHGDSIRVVRPRRKAK
ncbi:MAG: hypothetical protein JWN66_4948 [Sphingomonas bacterium]|uniref:hypothetical protein n=1 Tax=Sphingomonas bacterium TaxID=1895847 RepID=UPI002607F445|nr:hypothetical protein [Sphingomonas bacterium]MDB5707832.1 hypothetical protein [Sphingomonas bacterium]